MAVIHYERNQKRVYPTKTTLNLYQRESTSRKASTMALYILFAAVLVLLGLKVGVYDVYQRLDAKRAELAATENTLTQRTEMLKDYDAVEEQYTLYSYGYMSDEESALVDRTEVLDMVEKVLMPTAHVNSISITGASVSISMSGATLQQTAGLVSELEKFDIVDTVTVNTAASQSESVGVKNVDAQVVIGLVGAATAANAANAGTAETAQEGGDQNA